MHVRDKRAGRQVKYVKPVCKGPGTSGGHAHDASSNFGRDSASLPYLGSGHGLQRAQRVYAASHAAPSSKTDLDTQLERFRGEYEQRERDAQQRQLEQEETGVVKEVLTVSEEQVGAAAEAVEEADAAFGIVAAAGDMERWTQC